MLSIPETFVFLWQGWDDTLARKAEQFASSCRYERPSSQEYDAGYNIAIRRRHILERDSDMIKELVNSTVDGWARSRDNYVYGSHCGQGCNYAQVSFIYKDIRRFTHFIILSVIVTSLNLVIALVILR